MSEYRLERVKSEFEDNPEPRCACVLLLDTSGSMEGAPIQALNEGLREFKAALTKDELARLRVEVAIITFDSTVAVQQDFTAPDEFMVPTLTAKGLTHMGEGVLKAIDMVHTRKVEYRAGDVLYFRPWIFMITDGQPEGEDPMIFRQAAEAVRELEHGNHGLFFVVGVEGADMIKLTELSPDRAPVRLQGLNFRDLFLWLSASLGTVTSSDVNNQQPGQLALPPATGWQMI